MLNFVDINSFIHVSGCVGIGTSALPCPVIYNSVKANLGIV